MLLVLGIIIPMCARLLIRNTVLFYMLIIWFAAGWLRLIGKAAQKKNDAKDEFVMRQLVPISRMLFNGCDPILAAEQCERLALGYGGTKYAALLFLRVDAHQLSGDIEMAQLYLEMLAVIDGSYFSAGQGYYKWVLFQMERAVRCAAHHYLTEDYVEAGKWIEKLRDLTEDSAVSADECENYVKNLAWLSHILRMKNGEYDGASEFFQERFRASRCILEAVAAQRYLGELHLNNGSVLAARQALEYVIAHGNTTRLVAEARELIEKCPRLA